MQNDWKYFVIFASIAAIAEQCLKLRSSEFARVIADRRRSKDRNTTCFLTTLSVFFILIFTIFYLRNKEPGAALDP